MYFILFCSNFTYLFYSFKLFRFFKSIFLLRISSLFIYYIKSAQFRKGDIKNKFQILVKYNNTTYLIRIYILDNFFFRPF